MNKSKNKPAKKEERKSVKNLLIVSVTVGILGLITPFLSKIGKTMEFLNEGHSLVQIIKLLNTTPITGEFDKVATIPAYSTVTFTYTLPESGYYSLWNINSKGNFIRVKPKLGSNSRWRVSD